MLFRIAVTLIAVMPLVACETDPAAPSGARGFMNPPGPEPVAGTVTDTPGTFGLHGGFVIEEGRALTYNFQSVGRPGFEDIDSLDWTVRLTPARARDMIAGRLVSFSADETISRAVYPVGRGSVVRPVRSVQFTVSDNQLRADLVVELGPVADRRGVVPESFAPSATIRLWGVFPVACSVRGRVVAEEADGSPVYKYLQDPNFRTAFCHNAVVEYGLQPLLRMNNIAL